MTVFCNSRKTPLHFILAKVVLLCVLNSWTILQFFVGTALATTEPTRWAPFKWIRGLCFFIQDFSQLQNQSWLSKHKWISKLHWYKQQIVKTIFFQNPFFLLGCLGRFGRFVRSCDHMISQIMWSHDLINRSCQDTIGS